MAGGGTRRRLEHCNASDGAGRAGQNAGRTGGGRHGRPRAPAQHRQLRVDGLRHVREPAGWQRTVPGSSRAAEDAARDRRRARVRPEERARREPRSTCLDVPLRHRAAARPCEPPRDRRRAARSSVAGRARGSRRENAARPRAHGRRIERGRVHDRAGRHALARARPGHEVAGVGALDRAQHDARRPREHRALHGLSAVRRRVAAGRPHRHDRLAQPDAGFVRRGFVSAQRQEPRAVSRAARAEHAAAPRCRDQARRSRVGRASRRVGGWWRGDRVRGSPDDVRGVQQRSRYVRAARPREHAGAGQAGHAADRHAPPLRSQRRLARRGVARAHDHRAARQRRRSSARWWRGPRRTSRTRSRAIRSL